MHVILNFWKIQDGRQGGSKTNFSTYLSISHMVCIGSLSVLVLQLTDNERSYCVYVTSLRIQNGHCMGRFLAIFDHFRRFSFQISVFFVLIRQIAICVLDAFSRCRLFLQPCIFFWLVRLPKGRWEWTLGKFDCNLSPLPVKKGLKDREKGMWTHVDKKLDIQQRPVQPYRYDYNKRQHIRSKGGKITSKC